MKSLTLTAAPRVAIRAAGSLQCPPSLPTLKEASSALAVIPHYSIDCGNQENGHAPCEFCRLGALLGASLSTDWLSSDDRSDTCQQTTQAHWIDRT